MRSGNIHLVVAAALLFLFEAAALVCCNHQNTSTFHCVESERQALLKFKACFNDPSHMLSSWKGNGCCNWKGVRCDKSSHHIVSLNLRREGESWEHSLVINSGDDVASFLLDLKFLEHLDLSGNYFDGGLGLMNISPSFGLMKQLRYLNLSHAGFGGRITHQLGNLTRLRVLDLHVHYYDGDDDDVEAHDIRWVSQLGSLQHLDMGGVNLSSASSPNMFQVLNNLPSLSWLSLSRCGLNSSHLLLENHHPFMNSTFLRNIQYLDLSFNSFQGPIPDFISNMTSLESLHLSANGFVGPIPSFIGSMTSLRELDLSYNMLSGIIPPWVEAKSFYLRRLVLHDNQLSGGIPNSIGQLSELESLDLNSNNLNGSIPDNIGQLSKLKEFLLCNNKLTGAIPQSIGRLSNLKELDVSRNSLEGVVSEAHFASLSNLTSLNIGYNRLNCEFKSDWKPLFQLEYIDMNSCKFRTRFPIWLFLHRAVGFIDLSNCSISGSLPKRIGHMMPNLTDLYIGDNNLVGSIPKNIGYMIPNLEYLYLSNNHLTGSIPKSLCNSRRMDILDISNNQLSRNIPGCWRYDSGLRFIDLSSNNLSGLIPRSIGKLESLRLLRLNNNSLHGEIPSTLANCTELEVLDLGENDLSGNITWTRERSPLLWVFRLRKNKFSGNFPSELCYLSGLRILDLADNRLSGELPSCFDNLNCMVDDTCAFYGYETLVKEVMKGRYLEYERKISGMLYNLDLSSNNLEGPIPKELTLLTALIGLNLSHNHLSGAIPKNIGQLKHLESLDFSRNALSGTIPSSLSNINALSCLNLSYNNFSGPIPTGNQLQTLEDPSAIYNGNPLLCGPPLLTKCQRDHVQPPISTPSQSEDNQEDGHEKMWLYLIVASGFATGFWGVVVVLIFMKRWRYALFRMVDDVQDMIYVAFALKVKQVKKKLNGIPDDQ